MITKNDIVENAVFEHPNGGTLQIVKLKDGITDKRYDDKGKVISGGTWDNDIEALINYLNNVGYEKTE